VRAISCFSSRGRSAAWVAAYSLFVTAGRKRAVVFAGAVVAPGVGTADRIGCVAAGGDAEACVADLATVAVRADGTASVASPSSSSSSPFSAHAVNVAMIAAMMGVARQSLDVSIES